MSSLSANQHIHTIRSPNQRLALEFNGAGDILRLYETTPKGDKISYFYGHPQTQNPLLHPWSNRVEGGQFSFNGQTYTLRPLHGEENNALHGEWLSPWRVSEVGPDFAVLDKECPAQDGLLKKTPYAHAARQILRLTDEWLDVGMTVTNHGITLPFGTGLHPFLSRPEGTEVIVGVDKMENCGADMIPDRDRPIIAVPDHLAALSRGLIISNRNLADDQGHTRHGFRNADYMDNCFPGIDPAKGVHIKWPDLDGEAREMLITASANCNFGVIFVPGPGNDNRSGPHSFFCAELTTNGINMQNRRNWGDPDAGGEVLKTGDALQAATRYAIPRP
jgi:galactose mutarotase-like enzyme